MDILSFGEINDSITCIILADIDLILGKIESLNDLLRNQMETKISWSRVAVLKHNEGKYRKQRVTEPFQIISNRYKLRGNDSNTDDDTPVNTGRWSKSNIRYGRSDNENYHKKYQYHKLCI